MNKKLLPLFLASAALLPACGEQNQPPAVPPAPAPAPAAPAATAPAVSKADAVASVNGVYISKRMLETLEKEIGERSHGQTFPKEQLLEELIQRELLIQEGVRQQLDKNPEFNDKLMSVKNSLLSQAALQNYLKTNPVTDAEIKAEYDSKISGAGEEYKASHILLKTENDAKKVIAQLEKGAKFVELAKSQSQDPGSKNSGGDLGWFAAEQMVGPFSEAVIALKDGEYTKTPVQTQFGWHVIWREGARPLSPPPMDAVKEQIRPMLQRQKAQKMLEDLRKQAKVEILLPPETTPPKADAAPAPAESASPQPTPEATPAAEQTPPPAPAEPAASQPAEPAASQPAPAASEPAPVQPAPAQ